MIVKLAFDNKPETDEPLILTAKMKNTGEKTVQLDVDKSQISNIYYVYAKGKVVLATDDMAAAVQSADANKGVVIGNNLLYVWRLGQSQTQEPLTIE